MLRHLRNLALAVAAAAVIWMGLHAYARHRVRVAFAEAGMSAGAAKCMARRLDRRLTLRQIHQLAGLAEEPDTIEGVLRAVRRADDRRIVTVTTSSAVLCASGLAR